LLAWHNQDPVSAREIARNNAIYARQIIEILILIILNMLHLFGQQKQLIRRHQLRLLI
jgi:hypothetical protein